MKVLIWIGCCAAPTLISWVLEDFGINLYGIPLVLLQAGAVWLAIKLCKDYDWNQAIKVAAAMNMTPSEYARHNLSEEFLDKLGHISKTAPVEQLKAQLKACVNSGKITKEQYTILLKEYSWTPGEDK